MRRLKLKVSTVNEIRNLDKVAAEDLNFEVVPIDHSRHVSGNFITLDC